MRGLLTRLRTVLNDLERGAVLAHGVSKCMAERFFALEGKIRRMQNELRGTEQD